MGKFRGLTEVINLRVYEDGSVTLPGGFETALGASYDYGKVAFHDPWYEFVPRTNWPSSPNPDFYPGDLGDKHVTYRSPSGAAALRLVLEDAGDDGIEVNISVRDLDDHGAKSSVRSWAGTASSSPSPESLFTDTPVYEVLSLAKERTAGHVSLEALLSGEWVEVGRFGPRDTSIRLRKYSLPGAKEPMVVTILAKRRYLPVEMEDDEVLIDSIYVLRNAIEALFFEQEGDLKKASDYWSLARRALSDALSESRGSAVRTVPIYCRAAAGSKLRAIR